MSPQRTDYGPGVPPDPFPQYEDPDEVDAAVAGGIGGGGGSVATHEAAPDPHPQYDTAAEVATRVTDHENAANPHPQYGGDIFTSQRSITFVWDGTNWIEESRT